MFFGQNSAQYPTYLQLTRVMLIPNAHHGPRAPFAHNFTMRIVMKTGDTIYDARSAYPGSYKRVKYDILEIRQSLPMGQHMDSPVGQISEFPDHYEVEVYAPGHAKGDFIVTTDKSKLNVFAMRAKSGSSLCRYGRFDCDYCDCDCALTEDVDTDFASE